MKVLVACEFSGIVRDAFLKEGHDAISCDLLPTEREGPHIEGDVLPLLNEKWDLIIAHPPCTRLCNSGVRWLDERGLWKEMKAGAEFFKCFLDADADHIAVENPVMHKYAIRHVGRKHDFTVQPWQFGEPYTKRTCFWTVNLPALKPVECVSGRIPKVHHESPGPDRWKNRSRTYKGIAKAMAEQWGSL